MVAAGWNIRALGEHQEKLFTSVYIQPITVITVRNRDCGCCCFACDAQEETFSHTCLEVSESKSKSRFQYVSGRA
jgi:hypothetical protein